MRESSATRSTLLGAYYPSLDGLRAVAVTLVFIVHSCTPIWNSEFLRWGWVGVDIFFVLSGFLITGILYDSLHRGDYFRNFYIRRTLRIFPLFYAFWLLLLFAVPIYHIVWDRYFTAQVLYFGNFFLPGGVLGNHSDIRTLVFQQGHGQSEHHLSVGHLWSLCVEEQFYLVWPAVMYWVRSRRMLLKFCLAVVVAAPFLRMLFMHIYPDLLTSQALYTDTLSRADTLLTGAAIALWLRGSNPAHHLVRRFARVLLLAPAAGLALGLSLEKNRASNLTIDPFINGFGFSLIALMAAALLLLTIDSTTWWAQIMRWPAFTAIGRVSYGIYFLHAPLVGALLRIRTVLTSRHMAFALPVTAAVIVYMLAVLSFRFLESPFLALKSQLAPRSGAADDPPPYNDSQSVEAESISPPIYLT